MARALGDRPQLARALELGDGVVQVMHGLDGLAEALREGRSTQGIGQVETHSARRACPVCATSYAELDPRLFSYNSKHGWCRRPRRPRARAKLC
jgi:excinuclease ABC subunit A